MLLEIFQEKAQDLKKAISAGIEQEEDIRKSLELQKRLNVISAEVYDAMFLTIFGQERHVEEESKFDLAKKVEELGINSSEFAAVVSVVADKFQTYSSEHSGYVPRNLFIDRLRIAGQYLCLEILLVDYDGIPLLARREDTSAQGGEVGWLNKFHIPGMSVTSSMRGSGLKVGLLKKEMIISKEDELAFSKKAYWIGFTRQEEKERAGVIADTLFYGIKVDTRTEADKFHPALVRFDGNMENVIPEHQKVLAWYLSGDDRSDMFDTRD